MITYNGREGDAGLNGATTRSSVPGYSSCTSSLLQNASRNSACPARRRGLVRVIAVMGPTGSGKSTLISKIAAGHVTIGHGLNSCTMGINEIPCKVRDEYVVLVDTPGFNDSNPDARSDTDILAALADWMKETWDEGVRLSGIIYLHSINEVRMTGSSITNLRMFRKLCGDANLKNVILATTKWGITPESDAIRREQELRSANGFWAPYIAGGSKIRRFENTETSAAALVEEILQIGKHRFVPKIQEEVIQGKKLADTDAGAFLNRELVELRRKHENEQAALREEMEIARKEQDKIMQDALEKEREHLDERIAKTKEEQRIINMTEVERLQRRIQELERARQGQVPTNRLRFWHSRWKCLSCRNKKTSRNGEWTCSACGFTQINRI